MTAQEIINNTTFKAYTNGTEVIFDDLGILEGKDYAMIAEPYYNAGTGSYEAIVMDSHGNRYKAYFTILEGHENDEFEDTVCDWATAYGIDYIGRD